MYSVSLVWFCRLKQSSIIPVQRNSNSIKSELAVALNVLFLFHLIDCELEHPHWGTHRHSPYFVPIDIRWNIVFFPSTICTSQPLLHSHIVCQSWSQSNLNMYYLFRLKSQYSTKDRGVSGSRFDLNSEMFVSGWANFLGDRGFVPHLFNLHFDFELLEEEQKKSKVELFRELLTTAMGVKCSRVNKTFYKTTWYAAKFGYLENGWACASLFLMENMTEKPLVYKPLKNLLTESPNLRMGGRLDMIPWIKIYIVYVYYLLTIYGFLCVDHFLDTNFFLESWGFFI